MIDWICEYYGIVCFAGAALIITAWMIWLTVYTVYGGRKKDEIKIIRE